MVSNVDQWKCALAIKRGCLGNPNERNQDKSAGFSGNISELNGEIMEVDAVRH